MSFLRGKSPSFLLPRYQTLHQAQLTPPSLPPSVVRASLGAMSTAQDVNVFLNFLKKNFLEKGLPTAKSNIKRKRQQAQNLFDSLSSAAMATGPVMADGRTETGTGTSTVILPPSPTPTSVGEEGAVTMKPKVLGRVGSAISI